ncbi:MAG TPA: hypothetical protein VK034_12330 [Enhygromyxa sp.]|nr:hypothetical protein [Enhygromyxa sp.]
MTPSKLGSLSSSVLASVLATAVGLAPIHGALAAPPEETEVDVDAPEEGEEGVEGGEEGEEVEGEEVEGEEAEPEEADAELPEAEEVSEPEEPEAEEPPPPEIDEPGPMRPPEPTWGPKNQYPRNGKGMLITGGIVTGLGAAFIVTSVLITRCDFDSALSCKYGDQRDFLVPLSVATTSLGLLLIGVGVGNHVKYKKWKNWTPEQSALVPSYMPGGGGVAYVARF